ncbi:hypothetical protein H9Q13_00990 [Pontibacter sp. JH31]|uniref:Uncharacterized protein n=1 Tax=Pontibacter aquaedesilientis TaxID=2766980 RepID=A0ABR7XBQ8_9BACT|nr:hypothetical protein [Pontibacter aquaedesilientis]MBD1395727.1 hypothetical protein [Pontibacter aquaedesilientis]
METNSSTNPLENLLHNPMEILNVVKNPGKYGLDIYKGLDIKQQQYVLFAAGAALIGYGLYLGMNKK